MFSLPALQRMHALLRLTIFALERHAQIVLAEAQLDPTLQVASVRAVSRNRNGLVDEAGAAPQAGGALASSSAPIALRAPSPALAHQTEPTAATCSAPERLSSQPAPTVVVAAAAASPLNQHHRIVQQVLLHDLLARINLLSINCLSHAWTSSRGKPFLKSDDESTFPHSPFVNEVGDLDFKDGLVNDLKVWAESDHATRSLAASSREWPLSRGVGGANPGAGSSDVVALRETADFDDAFCSNLLPISAATLRKAREDARTIVDPPGAAPPELEAASTTSFFHVSASSPVPSVAGFAHLLQLNALGVLSYCAVNAVKPVSKAVLALLRACVSDANLGPSSGSAESVLAGDGGGRSQESPLALLLGASPRALLDELRRFCISSVRILLPDLQMNTDDSGVAHNIQSQSFISGFVLQYALKQLSRTSGVKLSHEDMQKAQAWARDCFTHLATPFADFFAALDDNGLKAIEWVRAHRVFPCAFAMPLSALFGRNVALPFRIIYVRKLRSLADLIRFHSTVSARCLRAPTFDCRLAAAKGL